MTYHAGKPLTLFVLLLTALAGAGSDWPQLLGPNRNGTANEKDLAEAWPKEGPPVVWERAVGEGFSSPVVADGVVYLFQRVDGNEVLEALDAATGAPRWKFDYRCAYSDSYGKGNGPRSTPVVADGKIYLLGASGILTCVDRSGKKVWQKALHEEYRVRPNFFGVGTSPLVEGDLLLVNVGAGEDKAGIVAFAKDTGKEVWKATDHDASYASPIAATIDGMRHVIFFTREGVVSLDPATGKVRFSQRWRSRNPYSVNAATPLLLEGKYLFVTASYGTGALLLEVKKDRAEEVWKSNEAISAHFNTPVAVGPYLFGSEGRQEAGANLRCIEWKTGKVRWTEGGFGCGSLIAVGDRLILLSESGELMLARASGDRYEELSRAAVLSRPVRASLALADGKLYGRDDRKLVCWKVKK
jgi:outer membrane protein assembly factor BamB